MLGRFGRGDKSTVVCDFLGLEVRLDFSATTHGFSREYQGSPKGHKRKAISSVRLDVGVQCLATLSGRVLLTHLVVIFCVFLPSLFISSTSSLTTVGLSSQPPELAWLLIDSYYLHRLEAVL